ncbi:MAG: bacteriohemerythrin [Candidatus Thiodiazotropha sp. (ex Ctena orbiculata)]|nr:bacteriohemerythrin [Candidatus Thiodiazotropha taylori]MBT2998790.1 bacteriohemerythrin [Candidatus Thiodiazotropha taylori]MBT3002334.1 bacteriohemerythrin [Candidatus Thiodiazotropha taylori]MBV2109047.1 bacteriohemerythrin [Candidatus Thiodiazotropha taylori]MBV2113244.1 bacteriohemerythrin [Candidatus Thiodiazotropha taylori]
MNNLMAPIVSLTNQLSYSVKFALVIVLFLVTIGYLSFELYAAGQFFLRHYIVVGTASVMLFLFSTGVYLSLTGNLERLRNASDQMSEGDLTQRLDIDTRDELNQIGTAFKDISDGFSLAVSGVVGSSQHLGTVTAQMVDTGRKTAVDIQRQADEIAQAVEAVDTLADSIQGVAAKSNQAAEHAESANQAVINGQNEVDKTISSINSLAGELEQVATAVKKLEDDSANIGGILEAIRGIADQTNLLALNAAIEAARAGEQGRGFAVVADEVRSLARRTQEETVRINSMIDQLQAGSHQAVDVMERSNRRTAETVDQAASAGKMLSVIQEAVSSINSMNIQIADGANHQTEVSENIRENIAQLDSLSQNSARDSGRLTASTVQVAALANEVNAWLNRFTVDYDQLALTRQDRDKDAAFIWDAKFSVGITEIDRQHKALMDMANELKFELDGKRSIKTARRILKGLIDYTATHFSYEEQLMDQTRYGEAEVHKELHRKLVDDVMKYNERIDQGDEKVLGELMAFIKGWLIEHIQKTDKKLGAHLQQTGLG